MSIFTKQFLVDAAERLVKTFLQTAIPLVVLTDLSTLDNAALAGAAAVLSALTSIFSAEVNPSAPGAALITPPEDEGRVPLPDEDPDLAAWLAGEDFSAEPQPDGGKSDVLTGDGYPR